LYPISWSFCAEKETILLIVDSHQNAQQFDIISITYKRHLEKIDHSFFADLAGEIHHQLFKSKP